MAAGFDKIEHEFNDNIVFVGKDFGYATCDPSDFNLLDRGSDKRYGQSAKKKNRLFHNLEVDLGHVDLLVEFRWEFCALEELCIDACRHGCCCLVIESLEM